MLRLEEFLPLIQRAIPRFAEHAPNTRQARCIRFSRARPLMIVAGPGSGKTTVLVLRALRFVFVDGFLPEEVVLTTFTRKAADEMRARLIEWGLAVVRILREERTDPAFQNWLDQIDINRFVSGTLDSICEDVLTRLRDPGDPAPVLVEEFVADALFAKTGLFPTRLHDNPEVTRYISAFTHEGAPPRNFGEVSRTIKTIVDRLVHDRVDIEEFRTRAPQQQAKRRLTDALVAYRAALRNTNRMDFALLEELFLDRLESGRLNERFTRNLRALLVDEYQDTNPLQEAIYFELIRQSGACLTIVGDDDQSLYRFRGATVELFRDFRARFQRRFHDANVQLEYLIENYRSTPEIVNFFNGFITCDTGFQEARVQPPKPAIVATSDSNGIPILGLFRDDRNTLAGDLATLLHDVFRGNGRPIPGTRHVLRRHRDGEIGDAVFLAHSVGEFKQDLNGPPQPRFTRLLRDELRARGIGVFNPRGLALRDIPDIKRLLGLMLECIDPCPSGTLTGRVELSCLLRNEARRYFTDWRTTARDFIRSNPAPNQNRTLEDFVNAWQGQRSQTQEAWPSEWPLLELCFKIISWIPGLRDNPEGQVYLEGVGRCISQAATYSAFRSLILFGDRELHEKSVKHALLDVFSNIALDAIDLDEEVMPSVPRTVLQYMTIHQAKGLEFPLVIVDVGTDFAMNHAKQRFKRFPDNPSSVQRLEDEVSRFCEIGPLRNERSSLDRTFDDLRRLYYVAFSRPQSAILLVGLLPSLQYRTSIRNVATGWTSTGDWMWTTPYSGSRPPALANNIPLTLL